MLVAVVKVYDALYGDKVIYLKDIVSTLSDKGLVCKTISIP